MNEEENLKKIVESGVWYEIPNLHIIQGICTYLTIKVEAWKTFLKGNTTNIFYKVYFDYLGGQRSMEGQSFFYLPIIMKNGSVMATNFYEGVLYGKLLSLS